MLIRSAIFLATFGTILQHVQLKPTCNFEENPSQTRDIMSKLSFRRCLSFSADAHT
jgi:hypothetical protein